MCRVSQVAAWQTKIHPRRNISISSTEVLQEKDSRLDKKIQIYLDGNMFAETDFKIILNEYPLTNPCLQILSWDQNQTWNTKVVEFTNELMSEMFR